MSFGRSGAWRFSGRKTVSLSATPPRDRQRSVSQRPARESERERMWKDWDMFFFFFSNLTWEQCCCYYSINDLMMWPYQGKLAICWISLPWWARRIGRVCFYCRRTSSAAPAYSLHRGNERELPECVRAVRVSTRTVTRYQLSVQKERRNDTLMKIASLSGPSSIMTTPPSTASGCDWTVPAFQCWWKWRAIPQSALNP